MNIQPQNDSTHGSLKPLPHGSSNPSSPSPLSHDEQVAGVFAPPPLLFLGGWLLAQALHRLRPVPIGMPQRLRRSVGGITILLGAGLSGAVVTLFKVARTPVSPLSSTTALVTSGPYEVSRNPDYVGQLLIYVGSAMLSDTAWPIALLPAVLPAIDRGVIRKEEIYLRRRFGRQYDDYSARVPRWL
jgi:protein-S-isoprenylcysteine O-methyltransferase Ste14